MTTPKVLLAIPAYNCADQIGRVLDRIDARLLERLHRVVVIDNGSSDDTLERARAAALRLGPRAEVWRNTENYGLGGTHKVAFLAGEREGADHVAILHGDDQADAQELHRLLDAAEGRPGAAAVLGGRFVPGARRVGYSRERVLGNLGINVIFTIVAGRRTRDLGSGLNLFRLEDLADHAYLAFDDGITFNIDLLLHYFRRRARLVYVPITWREEDQVSNARNLSVARSALEKLVRWRLGRPRPAIAARAYTSSAVTS